MKNEPAKLSPDLEQLLLEKNYEDLSPADRLLVEEELTIQEYRSYRLLLQESKELFVTQQTHPRPAVRDHLSNLVRSKKTTSSVSNILSTIFNYRIPAWQAALGIFALLFFIQPMSKDSVIQEVAPEKIYVYNTDTVYKDKPIFVTQKHDSTANRITNVSARKTPIVPVNAKRSIRTISSSKRTHQQSPNGMLMEQEAINIDSAMLNKLVEEVDKAQAIGRSAEQEKDLMDFFVEIY